MEMEGLSNPPSPASLTPPSELESILRSDHADPFQVLGMHEFTTEEGPMLVVRAFLREAVQCAVVDAGDPQIHFPLQRIHPDGFFEGLIPNRREWFPYRLRLTNAAGHTWEIEDPYRFPPLVGEEDLHLFAEGTCYRAYRFMGAHERMVEGVSGVLFVVWPPMPAGFPSWGISTAGMAAGIPCGRGWDRAFGSCSCLVWARGNAINLRSKLRPATCW